MKTKFYPLAALLIAALATPAQNAFMIRDLKIGGNTHIDYLTVSQNKVFFSANDSVGNQELFSSDGSDTGTVLVKDICPGACSGDPQELFDGGSKLYFHANHPNLGGQLYGSDGTAIGTDTVNTTVTKGGGQFANMNGETFFVGGMFSTTGSELYKTNGTSAGTILVKDIYPGVTGGMASNIFVVGNKLFFAGNDLSGYGLFTSDGSVGNATKILSMNFNTAQFSYRGSHNSKFYFSYNDSINGQELWASDGTIGGTVLLDLNTEVDGSSNPSEITVMNNEVYVVHCCTTIRKSLTLQKTPRSIRISVDST